MRPADFLGALASTILKQTPYTGWAVKRSTEYEPPDTRVRYEFHNDGLELYCDDDERIRTIFLRPGIDKALVDVPFHSSRAQVRERFGLPSKSGTALRHPVLGESGPWDQFSQATMTIHIQYRLDSDEIEMVTLMRHDVVP